MLEIVTKYEDSKMQIEGEEFKVSSFNEKLVKNIARFAQCQISPSCSFWGGVITQ